MEYVECSPSPHLLRKWSAISLLAGAMERKCWVRSMRRKLYPNLYTILLAPPGVGKTFLSATNWHFWDTLNSTHHLAPSSVTKAALVDVLDESQREVARPKEGKTIKFNSLLIVSNELNTLIPTYESDFMAALTDIYDCHPYSERRRGKGINIKIRAPQLNMIACTTPAAFNRLLPEGAWDQGFLSRCLLIYSGESLIGELELDEEDIEDDKSLKRKLLNDLRAIGRYYGPFTWQAEAKETIQRWHTGRGKPFPDHPKLSHYNTRRTAHLLKLCQVASVNDSAGMIITLEHYQTALGWLTEAERAMPDIFKAMRKGGDTELYTLAFHFAYKIYVKEKKPIPAWRMKRFVLSHTPAHNVDRILEVMVGGKLLKLVQVNKIGECYVPLEKPT